MRQRDREREREEDEEYEMLANNVNKFSTAQTLRRAMLAVTNSQGIEGRRHSSGHLCLRLPIVTTHLHVLINLYVSSQLLIRTSICPNVLVL